jgi:hypothetical protein
VQWSAWQILRAGGVHAFLKKRERQAGAHRATTITILTQQLISKASNPLEAAFCYLFATDDCLQNDFCIP